ncbi:MAG: hypothetical protein OEV42_14970 [Deltaproteobacteria bacterium]|nr:hypothetical protein [Deltaproteobacteria bacterium]
MSTACITINNGNFLPSYTERAVSDDANKLRDTISKVRREIFESVSIGEIDREIEIALKEITEECANDNWDGYGANAINVNSLIEAKRFTDTLPTTLPLPEVSVDPDGDISFEWYVRPRRVFSVSIGSDCLLSYAGIIGLNKVHGEEFFGDEIPKTITDNIQRIFS